MFSHLAVLVPRHMMATILVQMCMIGLKLMVCIALFTVIAGYLQSYYKSSKVCDPVLLPRHRFSTDWAEILQAGAGRDRERLHDLKF